MLVEQLKDNITEFLDNPEYQSEIRVDQKENFERYLSKKWQYFGRENYFDENLQVLYKAMNDYAFVLSRGFVVIKKGLLSYQTELLG